MFLLRGFSIVDIQVSRRRVLNVVPQKRCREFVDSCSRSMCFSVNTRHVVLPFSSREFPAKKTLGSAVCELNGPRTQAAEPRVLQLIAPLPFCSWFLALQRGGGRWRKPLAAICGTFNLNNVPEEAAWRPQSTGKSFGSRGCSSNPNGELTVLPRLPCWWEGS